MDVYQIVTEKIISMLERGTVPWKRPWATSSGMPKNLVSKKDYRGINVFLLGCQQYSSPYWLTYKQAAEKGGFVKQGEKSSMAVFFKMLDKREEEAADATGKIPMLRYYNLFNLEQCEGISSPTIEIPTYEFTPVERAEQIINGYKDRPEIHYGGNRCFYRPSEDRVQMAHEYTFEKSENFYQVLLHELAHSTGSKHRLARKEVMEKAAFGSDPYASEELVADLCSSFLCAHAGISNETIELSASYIDGWLSVLRKDKRMIISAASKAQAAADWILGRKAGDEQLA